MSASVLLYGCVGSWLFYWKVVEVAELIGDSSFGGLVGRCYAFTG